MDGKRIAIALKIDRIQHTYGDNWKTCPLKPWKEYWTEIFEIQLISKPPTSLETPKSQQDDWNKINENNDANYLSSSSIRYFHIFSHIETTCLDASCYVTLTFHYPNA